MSSSDIAIRISNLSKCYYIYDRPHDRLKQFILPRLRRLFGLSPSNHFREFWALKDVSFEIKQGETVGIIGRNGSGKSTLLQMICGTLNPTGGSVETYGRVAALLELGSGFNPEFTGRENVYMNASVLGLSEAEIEERFESIVAFADIGDFIEQLVKTYSSGMMLRLAFAVIAHVDADILVIDEALAVGDIFFTQKCMRFLRSFMKTGTVLFVSHDTSAVKNLCDRAIWLEKGVVRSDGSSKNVSEAYLQAFYEAQQGKSSTTKLKETTRPDAADVPGKDQRLDFINASNLRNDIQLFAFDPEAASFGKGGAQIVMVEFLDKEGAPLAWVVGGESVTLRIHAMAHEALSAPIIGFAVKDRLGQTLFGDNTYLSYNNVVLFCGKGEKILAEFTFLMPILPIGNYSVNVAVADGTQEQHVQHHWIHDAVLFKSESSSVATGLIGIPMQYIKLDVLTEI
ncbi:ABC transporter ATP-binding protein [Candidatus Methylospira mobilis]|uniref:ABC transporter ATP-binding protein n=1 Tax=Candidatus Methylospira mobilis TaxID=1808979 RepID=A0A5Q0BH14_9GAMM|nr:ABC transporter ATP-binding protein [Candidatus Methylospira mobilis]QFY41418.1 ABC transporter ATP-binding protein [Candidatus Methylospira mobilis]WNV05356.1 ABC transporter ATP-binding protein [Candidatus Methylospira mobilis]